MNSNGVSLNRRKFLYGSGIALSLPQFETFAASDSNPKDTPRRFVSIYHPDGVGLPLKADEAWKDWSWFPRGGVCRGCAAGIVPDGGRRAPLEAPPPSPPCVPPDMGSACAAASSGGGGDAAGSAEQEPPREAAESSALHCPGWRPAAAVRAGALIGRDP